MRPVVHALLSFALLTACTRDDLARTADSAAQVGQRVVASATEALAQARRATPRTEAEWSRYRAQMGGAVAELKRVLAELQRRADSADAWQRAALQSQVRVVRARVKEAEDRLGALARERQPELKAGLDRAAEAARRGVEELRASFSVRTVPLLHGKEESGRRR